MWSFEKRAAGTHVHVCVHAQADACVCTFVRASKQVRLCATCASESACVSVCCCVCTCMRSCVCTCVCMSGRMYVRVCVCWGKRLRTCVLCRYSRISRVFVCAYAYYARARVNLFMSQTSSQRAVCKIESYNDTARGPTPTCEKYAPPGGLFF